LLGISVLESSNEEEDSTKWLEPVVDGNDHSDDDDVVVPIGDDTDDVDVDNIDTPVELESWVQCYKTFAAVIYEFS